MTEAAGAFSGGAGNQALSSPCHCVNNTAALPYAALCTQGSAASCSRPSITAGPWHPRRLLRRAA